MGRVARWSRRLLLALALLVPLLAVWWQWPRDAGPYAELALPTAPQARAAEAAPPPGGRLRLSWWGVSAVLVEDGRNAIFIDPFFSRPEGLLPLLSNRPIAPNRARVQAGLAAAGVDTLDLVLVSHAHYDHSMDAGLVAQLSGATLAGDRSTLNVGRGAGLPAAQLRLIEPGDVLQVGDFRLTFVASAHAGATGGRPLGSIDSPLQPPARYSAYKRGQVWSVLIEHPEGRLLHHGSAGYVPGALAPYRADVALLGAALVEDWPRYLAQTAQAVGAHTVLPLHWDDFLRPLDEPLRPMPLAVDLAAMYAHFRSSPAAPALHTLPLGRKVALPAAPPDHHTATRPPP